MTQADLRKFLTDRSALSRTTTLFREAGLRALLLYLKPGETIPAHQTRGTILVQCLAGDGVFLVGEDRADLQPGVLISVPASVSHSVMAADQQDLLLLVTLSEPVATAQ